VAELLRNLSGNSVWLERPDLTEVRAATLGQSKTGRKVVEFTLSLYIKRLREEQDDTSRPGQGKPGTVSAQAGRGANKQ
jgi:type IV pilus assembly protein PilN